MSTEETTPMAAIIDCDTNTLTYRPLTDLEIAAQQAMAAEFAAIEYAREASIAHTSTLKASAKAKLIAGEPLTEEEASVLVI